MAVGCAAGLRVHDEGVAAGHPRSEQPDISAAEAPVPAGVTFGRRRVPADRPSVARMGSDLAVRSPLGRVSCLAAMPEELHSNRRQRVAHARVPGDRATTGGTADLGATRGMARDTALRALSRSATGP